VPRWPVRWRAGTTARNITRQLGSGLPTGSKTPHDYCPRAMREDAAWSTADPSAEQ
jgi:hypothetical protein